MAYLDLNRQVISEGGPGGASPGDTVVTETSFGQSSAAGNASTFSRSDHTHGTPAAPTIPAGSSTVASETSFGATPSAGSATTYSKGDHTHGTPADPVTAHVAAGDPHTGYQLESEKAAANGYASLDANSLLVQAVQRLLAGTAAVTSTEGYIRWHTTNKVLGLYDAVLERSLSDRGWMPYAYPIAFAPNAAFTTALALAANGGSIAVPIWLDGHMLLQSVSVRNTDTATARTWGWDLYEQYQNSGQAAENTLARVAACTSNETFTPSAASTRTVAVGSAPVYLGPGLYWLVVQNRHATSTFGQGSTAAGAAFALNTAQTKTTGNPNGATLDFVAATWTKVTAMYAVRLNGRVFGQSTAF